MRISDWSSDVCSSDLVHGAVGHRAADLVGEPGQLLGVLLEVLGVVVAHGAQGLAGVGPGDDGVVVSTLDQRLAVAGHDVRLRGGDEAGAHPHAVGAEGEGGGQAATVEDAAGRDDGSSEEHTSELQSLMSNSYADFRLTTK